MAASACRLEALKAAGVRAARTGRLKRRAEFLAAATGRRFHTERMTVQGRLREPDGQGLRFGFTVTKKVGHATERNRIRRRLRNAAAETAGGPAATDADIVVIGRRDILAADYHMLVADLGRALKTVTKPKDAGRKSGAVAPEDTHPAAGAAESSHAS